MKVVTLAACLLPLFAAPRAHALISGGENGFFWLPPIAQAPAPVGTFDAALHPVLEVDRFDPSAPGGLRTLYTLHARAQLHHHRFAAQVHTRQLALNNAYRLRVLLGGRELGVADFVIVRRRDLGKVDRSKLVPVVDGASLAVHFFLSAFAAAPPALSLSASGGVPGTLVVVHGTGFAPSAPLALTFDPAGRALSVADTTTGVQGDFLTSFTVPQGFDGASYPVRAAQPGQRLFADSIFAVSYAPSITLQSAVVHRRQVITFAASGFEAADRLDIALNGGIVESIVAGPTGAASITLYIPDSLPAGNGTLSVTGKSGTASAALSVVANTTVACSPASGPPGTSVTCDGDGFFPGALVQLRSGALALGSATADALGAFSVAVKMPPQPAGAQAITATDASSPPASASFTYVYSPAVTATPATVAEGGTIHLAGGGFFPGDTLHLAIAGIPLGDTTADAGGSFSADVIAPSILVTNPVSIGAAGDLSQATASTMVTLLRPGQLTVTPAFVTPGIPFTVQAMGFVPLEKIQIGVEGVPIVELAAGADGHLDGMVNLSPLFNYGPGTITAVGELNSLSTSANLFVQYQPTLSAGQQQLTPGSAVSVTGAGWEAGETVSLQLNGTDLPPATPDSNGAFTATLTLPALADGTYLLNAHGQLSNADASVAVIVYTQTPFLGALDNPAIAGRTITLIGQHFLPQEAVQIAFDGQAVLSVRADASGNFSTPLRTPVPAAPGAHQLTATGARTDRSASYSLSVGFQPSGSASPMSALVGVPNVPAIVTISASGFAADEPIRIALGQPGDTPVIFASATSDAAGNVTAPVTIPLRAPDTYRLAVSGDNSGAFFTIDGFAIRLFAPAYGLSRSPARPFDQEVFSGISWLPGEIVDLYIADPLVPIASPTADSSGAFSATVAIPMTDPGVYMTRAVGRTSGSTRTQQLEIYFQPVISIVNPIVSFRGTLIVNGSGFRAGDVVQVGIFVPGNAVVWLRTFMADPNSSLEVDAIVAADGTFQNVYAQLPDNAAGDWETIATGLRTNAASQEVLITIR